MKKFLFLLTVLFLAVSLYGKNPKYVFLFIGDGMSVPQRMVAEEYARYAGQSGLAINAFLHQGMTRTMSRGLKTTDSAASATAIACGEKTENGRLGIDANGKNLESVAYLAKRNGKKVGIVTSVAINHATPGGFYAHRLSRGEYYEISLDMIASNFDYFGGGYAAKHDDKKSPLYKGNIYDLAKQAGFTVIRGKDGFDAVKPGGKVLAVSDISYIIDSKYRTAFPSLAEYTAKGIELLNNPNGFFMMVEGGLIDYGGHINDAAANMFEVLELDKAVKVALKFAEKHPEETLIIVTGDHETGGMTVNGTNHRLNVEYLAAQKCSVGQFKKIVKEARKKAGKSFSFDDAKKLLTEYFGFDFSGKSGIKINADEERLLKSYFEKNQLETGAKQVMSKKVGINWTTGGHTRLPVLTTSYGTKAEMFTGLFENSDIARKLKTIL